MFSLVEWFLQGMKLYFLLQRDDTVERRNPAPVDRFVYWRGFLHPTGFRFSSIHSRIESMITPLLNDCKISPWAQLYFIWFLHVFLVEPDGYQEASILWWPCYLLQVFGTDVPFCASWRSPEKGFKWWLLQLKVFWGGFFIANPVIFKYV